MPRPIDAKVEAIRLWTQINMDAEVDLASMQTRRLTEAERAKRQARLRELGSPFPTPTPSRAAEREPRFRPSLAGVP
jgi:hypothetical protein